MNFLKCACQATDVAKPFDLSIIFNSEERDITGKGADRLTFGLAAILLREEIFLLEERDLLRDGHLLAEEIENLPLELGIYKPRFVFKNYLLLHSVLF